MRKISRPELDGLFYDEKGCERDALQLFLITLEHAIAIRGEEGMVPYV